MTDLPVLPDYCWPVDWSCLPGGVDGVDPDLVARAEALAVMSLRMLTLGQVGGCPITVRPCSLGCAHGLGIDFYDGVWMWPHLQDGNWVNACGCRDECSCTQLSEVLLPGPVGEITQVTIDGGLVDSHGYRVDNGNRLVRLGGSTWPVCQDMAAGPNDPGSFTVTYLNAIPVDGLASYAAGLLAAEFLKDCQGQECALPRNVVSITRSGVSIELSTGVFPNNRTGLDAVDAWLARFNPYAVLVPSVISSPDDRPVRRTTWASS